MREVLKTTRNVFSEGCVREQAGLAVFSLYVKLSPMWFMFLELCPLQLCTINLKMILTKEIRSITVLKTVVIRSFMSFKLGLAADIVVFR